MTTSRNLSVEQLLSQLSIARNELNNLRQQVNNLKYSYKKDVNNIVASVSDIRGESAEASTSRNCTCELSGWSSIGVIKTWFPGKRGVPRQAVVCPESEGVIILSSSSINNPAYSLTGLEEYSHMWILYYFHETEKTHVRTKVAPPRLDGERIGVFATRAPHRPCPIGLSLVRITRIEGAKVFFLGVDMVDGTPVLDIKPYIPQYDCPDEHLRPVTLPAELVVQPTVRQRLVEGGHSTEPSPVSATDDDDDSPDSVTSRFSDLATGGRSEREAPDGEEGPVHVAKWVKNPATRTMEVVFSDRAICQLSSLPNEESLKTTIMRLLEQDPRSTYLRRKRGYQFYTFKIASQQVSVKFEDGSSTATVTSIQTTDDFTQ